MPDLKPGTLCWMTNTSPENMGKITEVLSFWKTEFRGDLYHCKALQPVTVCRLMKAEGGSYYQENFRQETEITCWRHQLIPINDPKLSGDLGIESVEDQLKSLPLTRI